MRIGMMADIYKPYVSGVTIHIEMIKKYLESSGHTVYIFTFGDDDYVDNEENVIRSPGLSIDLPSVEGGLQINMRYDRYARELLGSMDIVHTHHPFISGMLAMRYCKPRGIPIVFTNHTRYDLYYQAYLPMLPDNLGENLLQVYFPYFFKSCDLVIAPSKGIGEVLQGLGVDADMAIVPNGIDLEFIRERSSRMSRAEMDIEEDEAVLIYVGRLGPEKNIDFLLRTFANAIQSFEKGRLLLVGDGPDREKSERLVKELGIYDNVIFAGAVDYQDVPGYLGIADAFVTASYTEVHPLTLMEGTAVGLPSLGIRSPGIEDIIQDGQTGYLVNNDFDEFSNRMLRLLRDSADRQRMSELAYIRAERFSIGENCDLLLRHYHELVDRTEIKGVMRGGKIKKLRSRLKI